MGEAEKRRNGEWGSGKRSAYVGHVAKLRDSSIPNVGADLFALQQAQAAG
jgi:hypothetical protein